MVGVLGWILFGLVVGIVAKLLMPGRDPGGLIITTLLGIVGAVIGGFLLGGPTINSNAFNLTALLVSFVGAVVLLAIVNLVTRGRVR